MSTESTARTGATTSQENWVAAAIAGIVGTIALGGLQMALGSAETIAGAFPALYTLGPSLAIGWAVHLFHGAVLGVVFAALVSRPPLGGYVDGIGATLGAGVVTTVALAWVLLPIWLRVVGFPQAPPLPNVGMSSLVGHLVYGVVLAGVYAGLSDRL
ncbi:histidine kinase [Halobacteriales archaeon QS_3_64_16]|nr:MAG: histidine kinase [Halobacteriales archaeon QS_3_64_16]